MLRGWGREDGGLLAEEEGDEDLGVEEVVTGGDDFGLGVGERDLGVGAFGDAGKSFLKQLGTLSVNDNGFRNRSLAARRKWDIGW